MIINGRDIQIRTITVADLPAVCSAISPFIDEFNDIAKTGDVKANDLFVLCSRHAVHIVQLCVVMTDADREFLMALSPKELFDLTAEVITQSHDFFLHQIAKPILNLQRNLNTLILTGIKS